MQHTLISSIYTLNWFIKLCIFSVHPVFAPPPIGFNVTTVTATSVSLQWSAQFAAVILPERFVLSYSGIQLSGLQVTIAAVNVTVDSTAVASYALGVSDLLPYTEYSFSLVAIYGDDTSTAETLTSITLQDGRY